MVYMSIHRLSESIAHVTVVHTDYRVAPAQSWVVLDLNVPVPPAVDARRLVQLVASALSVEAYSSPNDIREGAAEDERAPGRHRHQEDELPFTEQLLPERHVDTVLGPLVAPTGVDGRRRP
jgi:hypothetical protein